LTGAICACLAAATRRDAATCAAATSARVWDC
jgi:hypothetical protein